MKTRHKILLAVLAVPVLIAAVGAWVVWGGVSNPAGRSTIGEIRPPLGYKRVEVPEGSFGAFVRAFPLQKRGSRMLYYSGDIAYFQYFGYAVLDIPLISIEEYCADAVQRIHSEYLWNKGDYGAIHFHSLNGKDMRYSGGADRKAFEQYLRRVYGSSSTVTLRKYMKEKDFKDVAPGDVLVYTAHSPNSYGHAVLVADVAVNARTGKKALMLVQSSMPALTPHVIRNMLRPWDSPWVIVDEADDEITMSGIHFQKTDLRTW